MNLLTLALEALQVFGAFLVIVSVAMLPAICTVQFTKSEERAR